MSDQFKTPNGDGRASVSIAINVLLFLLGALLNLFSYGSIEPIAAAAAFYLVTLTLLSIPMLGGKPERHMFSRVFCVGFLMAGVAAVYAIHFQDPSQLRGDAAGFHYMATVGSKGLTLEEIQPIFEGALVIVVWRSVYDFFHGLGFKKGPYIGMSINITAVALSGVCGIKMVRQIFGEDSYRFRRITQLVASCGLFWLFAAVHLRDSVVLLAMTLLALAWLQFLAKPDFGWRLLVVIFWNLLAYAFFDFLRGEFLFVPVAMALAAIGALYVSRVAPDRQPTVYGVMIVGGILVFFLLDSFAIDIQDTLEIGRLAYGGLTEQTHSSDSLGLSLIVNQPVPIRMILGSIYLCVFPIPFWGGLQLESVYHFFKSANAMFFFFVLPMLAVAVMELYLNKNLRVPKLVFPLFLTGGFTVAIAVTSLESRHFGSFLMPMFAFATLPDLRDPRVRKSFETKLVVMLSAVAAVHLLWMALKFR